MPSTISPVTDTLIDKLKHDLGIDDKLPGGSLVHIDRPLPFVCVYRYPKGVKKSAVASLLTTQPAYILLYPEDEERIVEFLTKLSEVMGKRFGAYLLQEIWAGPPNQIAPYIIYDQQDEAEGIVVSLINELKTDEFSLYHKPVRENGFPQAHKPLLSEAELNRLSVHAVGLQLKQVYSNNENKKLYPVLYRRYREKLGRSLQKFFFDFIRIQTKFKVEHFHGLGRRKENELVWQIDQELVEISNSFDFLMLTSVVNTDEAWQEFKKANYNGQPTFRYRFIPIDPEMLKRKLYNIKIEDVEDPTLAFIFRDKRMELERMLSMLSERNSPNFHLTSIQVFGGIEEELLDAAYRILANCDVSSQKKEDEEPIRLSTQEFVKLAEQEIEYLKRQYQALDSKVTVRSDIGSLMVSRGQFYVKEGFTTTELRAKALIQHEVGTHVLTYYNGKAQPLRQMYVGTPGYEDLQEGLAVMAEYLVGGLNPARLRTLAGRVLAVDCMLKSAGFSETFKLLHSTHNFPARTAYNITERVYRGGGMTKDAVYLRGLLQLLEYIGQGKKIEPLLIGKIKQDYLPLVDELVQRHILKPAPIIPRYLTEPDAVERLQALRHKADILSLL